MVDRSGIRETGELAHDQSTLWKYHPVQRLYLASASGEHCRLHVPVCIAFAATSNVSAHRLWFVRFRDGQAAYGAWCLSLYLALSQL